MKHGKEIVLSKCDGSVECFAPSKLSTCLARALQGREDDARLAEPLARAVAMHLREWSGSAPPTTQYVFRCICSVLQQTGLGDVADDLHRYRRRRTADRRRIRVVDTRRGPGAGRTLAKAGAGRDAAESLWVSPCRGASSRGRSKARLGLSYRVITRQQFMVELTKNEVLAWGLGDRQVLDAVPASPQPVAAPAAEGELTRRIEVRPERWRARATAGTVARVRDAAMMARGS